MGMEPLEILEETIYDRIFIEEVYKTPIQDIDHAITCLYLAEERYKGKAFRNDYGIILIRDAIGITHVDKVLCALSFVEDLNIYNR